MVGGSMVAIDRRTSGAQLDDQAIELQRRQRSRASLGDRGHVNVTSYNRLVLLTGEVPTEADQAAVEQVVAQVENVRAVVNELAVMPNSSLTHALERHADHRQGQGRVRRRQGPAGQRLSRS